MPCCKHAGLDLSARSRRAAGPVLVRDTYGLERASDLLRSITTLRCSQLRGGRARLLVGERSGWARRVAAGGAGVPQRALLPRRAPGHFVAGGVRRGRARRGPGRGGGSGEKAPPSEGTTCRCGGGALAANHRGERGRMDGPAGPHLEPRAPQRGGQPRRAASVGHPRPRAAASHGRTALVGAVRCRGCAQRAPWPRFGGLAAPACESRC
mmetsp:Transcript_44476/g.128543  ORF Transcript_44476/g.128543 Transcript_44476/m.128543 type:complete len:210 (-) Transcript_44476:829-1458(-)